MQTFFDNINYKITDDIKVSISEGGRLNIAATTFSIYAFLEFKEPLLNIKDMRLIFTKRSFSNELLDRFRHLCKGENKLQRTLCKELNRKAIDGFNMKRYSKQSCNAVSKEENDFDSSFSSLHVELFTQEITGIDNLEVDFFCS